MGTQRAVATSCRVSLLFFIRARPVLLRIPNSRESVPRQASTACGDTGAVWNSLQEGDMLQRPPQKSPWTRSVPPELSYTLLFNAAWFELVFPSLSPLGISVWINQPIVQQRKRHNRILRLFRPPAAFRPQPGGGSAQSRSLRVRCSPGQSSPPAPEPGSTGQPREAPGGVCKRLLCQQREQPACPPPASTCRTRWRLWRLVAAAQGSQGHCVPCPVSPALSSEQGARLRSSTQRIPPGRRSWLPPPAPPAHPHSKAVSTTSLQRTQATLKLSKGHPAHRQLAPG